MISKIWSEGLSGWRERKLGLGGLLGYLAPSGRLHHFQKASPLLAFYPYDLWYKRIPLCLAYFSWREMTEVTGKDLQGFELVENLEIVLGVKYFNYFFFFFFPSSPPVVGCEEVATSLALYWTMGSTFNTPCGLEPGLRKPGTTMLIKCKRGFLAFIWHFGAWKLDEIRM